MPVRYKSLEFLGFPDYRVGVDGSVWTRKVERSPRKTGNWRKMILNSSRRGYLAIRLCHQGCKAIYLVHRLVLLAFVGPCPEGMQARHYPDRTRSNNNLNNLSWSTQEVNQGDRIEHNTDSRGEKSGKAKLNNQSVREIRRLAATGRYSSRGLGRMFNVGVDCIISVIAGRTWNHLQ